MVCTYNWGKPEQAHSDVMYAGRVCGWIYLCCIRLADNILTGDIRSADKVFTASIFGNES